MKRVLLSLSLFVVILGVLGAGGCGSSKNDGFSADDGGLFGDGSSGDDAGLFGDGGTCRGLHCSSDLHSVIDCDGNVVTACPPDQGCAGTACVAACDSAKANKSTFGCDYFVATPDEQGRRVRKSLAKRHRTGRVLEVGLPSHASSSSHSGCGRAVTIGTRGGGRPYASAARHPW